MKQRGVALLLVLLLLPMALLMLLLNVKALLQLQQVTAVQSIVLKEEQHEQLALAAFEENVLANLHCVLPAAEGPAHGLHWWQEHACLWQYAGENYYVLMTDLGLNPCLGARFYQIQFLSGNLAQSTIERVLQSVYAVPVGKPNACPEETRFHFGRQHWRLA